MRKPRVHITFNKVLQHTTQYDMFSDWSLNLPAVCISTAFFWIVFGFVDILFINFANTAKPLKCCNFVSKGSAGTKNIWSRLRKDLVLAQNTCFGCRRYGWRSSRQRVRNKAVNCPEVSLKTRSLVAINKAGVLPSSCLSFVDRYAVWCFFYFHLNTVRSCRNGVQTLYPDHWAVYIISGECILCSI